MTHVLKDALNQPINAVSLYIHIYADIFDLPEDKLLDLVTKAATIKREVHEHMLDSLQKTLEKMKQ